MSSSVAYEPRDLGTHTATAGCGGDEKPRCHIGHHAVDYLGLDAGDELRIYEGQPAESVIITTTEYASVLDDVDLGCLGEYAVSPGKGGYQRSRIAQNAAAYLNLEDGDDVTIYYGEPGRYALAEIGENPPPGA